MLVIIFNSNRFGLGKHTVQTVLCTFLMNAANVTTLTFTLPLHCSYQLMLLPLEHSVWNKNVLLFLYSSSSLRCAYFDEELGIKLIEVWARDSFNFNEIDGLHYYYFSKNIKVKKNLDTKKELKLIKWIRLACKKK